MTVLVDLNVILDVVQRRDPHYRDAAILLSKIIEGNLGRSVPGHAITTIYYLVRRHTDRERAEETVDWLLDHLAVIAASEADFRAARQLPIDDFEDAVVAQLAVRDAVTLIATRNTADFEGAPVPAKPPGVVLAEIS
jgi:predicted nucleic acid-binding protein